MKKLLQSLFILMLITGTVMAQNRTITGTVTDERTGAPVPGVTVKISGSNTITQTNANGSFSISAPASARSITFSSLGFTTQTVSIGTGNTINVALVDSANELNEVVVVAYGTVKKENFTGAATTVSSKTLENRPTTSFQKSLQGAAAGVQVNSTSGQPGGATSIRVRGEGSITSNSNPLYVVDGIPISPSGNDLTSVAQTADVLSSLNPNDIETVTILKDAAAAAIYGSRGSNGVVLITTKQGKNGVTRFTASVTGGVSSQAVEKHDFLNAEEYYRTFFNGYYDRRITAGDSPTAAAASANASTRTRLQVNPFNTAAPFLAGGVLAPGAALLYDTDWRDEIQRTGVTKDINVSASGGTDKVKFYASGGYFDQKGIVIGSDFRRFTGKFNISNTVNDFFSWGMNNNMSNSWQNTPPGAGGGANPVRFADITSNIYTAYLRDANGSPRLDVRGFPIYSYLNPVSQDFNPLGLSKLDQYLTKITRLSTAPYAQVKFLKNFTAKSTVSLDYSAIRENQFYNLEHGNGVLPQGRGYRYAKEDITTTFINTLTYDKTFGKHSVNVLLGQEAFKNTYDNFSATKTGFPFPGVTELSTASTPASADSDVEEKRFSSYFSRATYDFDSKYYFSASLRRDGYSGFGEQTKYGNFPSAGVAWRLSQEDFLKDVNFINELKLRASYGVTGNYTGASAYGAKGLYSLDFAYEGQAGSSYNQLANPDLQWEKSVTTEIGLEFSILNRKLSGEIAVFNKSSDKLLFSRPLSRTTGFTSILSNLADMDNKGIEISLNANPVTTKDFNWNVSFNFTAIKNEVKRLTQPEVTDGTKLLKVGENRFQWYLYEYAGIDKADGAPMWYRDDANGNKVTTKSYANAKLYTGLGTAMPDFTGGFNNTLNYKDFDLSVFTYFAVGGKTYDALYQELMHNGASAGKQMSRDVLNAWSPTNTGSDIPRFLPSGNTDQGASTSSRFLFSGTYMRIKNITLGYNLNKSWASKVKLGTARLFIMAENPFTFAAHKGRDPEASVAGASNNDIPNIKTFSAGLSVGF